MDTLRLGLLGRLGLLALSQSLESLQDNGSRDGVNAWRSSATSEKGVLPSEAEGVKNKYFLDSLWVYLPIDCS